MGYNATYGNETPDLVKEEGQESFLTTDAIGNLTIKAEHRVNKKQKPMLRTITER